MVVFCTFGSSNAFPRSLERIRHQANAFGVFRSIFCYSEKDLEAAFLEEHKDWFRQTHTPGKYQSSNGYGFYIWKPQIILQALAECQENEVLVYADCGCTLNREGLSKLQTYIREASETSLVSFQLPHVEKTWTKGHVLDLFSPEFRETGQFLSGIFLLKNCERIRTLIQQWKTLMSTYCNADNSPSKTPNDASFREHRHDQSVFSLLRKEYAKTNPHTVYPDVTYWEPHWNKHLDEPFHATRTRT